MLGSDSGLISDDADTNLENQYNNDTNNTTNNNASNSSIHNSPLSNKNLDNKLKDQKEDTNNNDNNNSNNNCKNTSTANNNESNIGQMEFDKTKLLQSKEMDSIENSKTLNATTTTTTTTTVIQPTTTSSPSATTTQTTPSKTSVTSNAVGGAGGTLTTTTKATTSVTGSTLDTQLAILRKEMYGLRQLDLSLLSQLWALNDSIHEFRTMIESQEPEGDSYSPHSPTPSSYDSVSSDADDDNAGMNKKNKTIDKSKIITTQPKLTQRSNSTTEHRLSNGSIATAPLQRPSPSKPFDMRPVPRMRSAPPPPPTVSRKSAAPPRPT